MWHNLYGINFYKHMSQTYLHQNTSGWFIKHNFYTKIENIKAGDIFTLEVDHTHFFG